MQELYVGMAEKRGGVMREILFKAKRIDNGEWVEGAFLPKTHEIIVNVLDSDIDTPDSYIYEYYKVDIETICQYTGLADKNGNKIWENDIIKYRFEEDTAVIKYGEYQNCFDTQRTYHVGFYVDWEYESLRKDLGFWVRVMNDTVIGNIFDNPELLEVER